MIQFTVLSAVLFYVIMTSQAMPSAYSRVPEDLNSEAQSRDTTLGYYQSLSTILQGLRQLKIMQSHLQREIISQTTTTTTTSAPQAFRKRNNLSINQELKSLANLLLMRENKRRRAQDTKIRSRLLSIGKRSVPHNQDHSVFVNEVAPVTEKGIVVFLTKLFPEISKQEMTYIIDQFLGNQIVNRDGYQGEELLPFEV